MSVSTHTFDFDRLDEAVALVDGYAPTVSVHGTLIGLLCSGQRLAISQWIEIALECCEAREEASDNAKAEFEALYNASLALMESEDMDFDLLIPDDKHAIVDRAQALADWCSAFLSALANYTGGLKDASEETQEILEDLVAISSLDAQDLEDDGSDDSDLETVIEHVRLCAINLFYEYNSAAPQEDTPLH